MGTAGASAYGGGQHTPRRKRRKEKETVAGGGVERSTEALQYNNINRDEMKQHPHFVFCLFFAYSLRLPSGNHITADILVTFL